MAATPRRAVWRWSRTGSAAMHPRPGTVAERQTGVRMPPNASLTPRERMIAALERQPLVGRVPPFELVFYLTMEAFGKVHPTHRHYAQWDQMSESERRLHRSELADIYI